MTIVAKLGTTFWLLGMLTVVVGCSFGIAGVESVAVVVATIGASVAVIGAFFGIIAILTAIWRS